MIMGPLGGVSVPGSSFPIYPFNNSSLAEANVELSEMLHLCSAFIQSALVLVHPFTHTQMAASEVP